MTTPDHPAGGPVGPGDEGVVRVFPAPPETPETVAPTPPIDADPSRPRPTPTPGTAGGGPIPPPPPFAPTIDGPPSAGFDGLGGGGSPTGGPTSGGSTSTGDEAKAAASDVKDTAQQQASQVAGTAQQQASEVAQTAQQQAGQVKDTAASAAQDVAATTREQVQNVVGEASQQARQIADSLTSQLQEQAGTQQQRAAGSLRDLAQGVSDMAEGRGAPSGPLGDYTRQAADRLQSAAGYLESKQPGELLDDVRSFAARRPGAFLFGAAVAGFAVGRLVKGASGGSGSGSGSTGSTGSVGGGTSSPGTSVGAPVGAFGDPTVPPVTPAPGYETRIPAEPLVDEPYPTDSGLGGGLGGGGLGGGRPVRDPALGPDDLYPGSPGGGPGV